MTVRTSAGKPSIDIDIVIEGETVVIDTNPVPCLTPVRGGFEAICGQCLTRDERFVPTTAEAWSALRSAGWTAYQPNPASPRDALCPECTKVEEDRTTAR